MELHDTKNYDLKFLYAVALKLAAVSSAMCKDYAKHRVSATQKADKTWVTEADLAIESKLREEIAKSTPGIRILGEEEGGEPLPSRLLANASSLPAEFPASDLCWVLDPIDGTFSFVHGVPFYSSLIALCYRGAAIVGVACLPGLDIEMSAYQGGGYFLNGEKVIRPPSACLNSAPIEIVATADHYRFVMEGKEKVLNLLLSSRFKTRTYPDALGYYLLLNGSVRAFVDPKVEVWDVAPFYCILPEAGCAIHPWSGTAPGIVRGTSVAYALDEFRAPLKCHDVLELLQS